MDERGGRVSASQHAKRRPARRGVGLAPPLRTALARRSVVAMAPRSRPRSALGPLPAPRLVKSEAEELYDYEALRQLGEPSMMIGQIGEPTFVLGSAQPREVLKDSCSEAAVRRRRGGGGVVLLQPGDLWVDWWIPRDDERWSYDVRASSVAVGSWWSDALSEYTSGTRTVHTGALEGDEAHRVACFAGRGPGEVFVDQRKTVGLTQWRVREGIFVSTVLHAHPSTLLLGCLRSVPTGLASALRHHTTASLQLSDAVVLYRALQRASGQWRVRDPLLRA